MRTVIDVSKVGFWDNLSPKEVICEVALDLDDEAGNTVCIRFRKSEKIKAAFIREEVLNKMGYFMDKNK
jgi:hypothetical protein